MALLETFEGIFSAVPTPFNHDGTIDLDGLMNLMAWQKRPQYIASALSNRSQSPCGIDGFVLYGTTGEAPTLSLLEKEQITEAALGRFGQLPLVAGIGTNSTASSIELARQVRSWGVKAGLLVTPYYNKPSQEGLYRHILSVAEGVSDWPLILYTVPSRTAVTLDIDTVHRILEACPQVIAIKDASADLNYCAELVSCCAGRANVLSGDDPTALAAWSIGAKGSISVVSNLFTAEFMKVWDLFNQNQLTEARRYFLHISPILSALFTESNPIPLKAALSILTHQESIRLSSPLNPSVRLPLTELSHSHIQVLTQSLHKYLRQVSTD